MWKMENVVDGPGPFGLARLSINLLNGGVIIRATHSYLKWLIIIIYDIGRGER